MGALVLTGCTQVVGGTATPESAAPPAAAARPGLQSDVLTDECLLTTAEITRLVGRPVDAPAQGDVARGDGSTGSSCVAAAGAEPVAMINVYRVRSGVPADVVRSAVGRHDLRGVGDAAAVLDTVAGPTLQVAGPRFLVTILVAGRMPDDEAWRAAAAAALGRLPA
ncbi:hypothetical protein WEH80_20600 [Actinomycetes bacterium KLBMP 9759]